MEDEPTRPKARSFSVNSSWDCISRMLGVSRDVAKNIERTIALQIIIFTLGILLAESGLVITYIGIAAAAWWIGTAMIVSRRRKAVTSLDISYLRIGFVTALLLEGPIYLAVDHFRDR